MYILNQKVYIWVIHGECMINAIVDQRRFAIVKAKEKAEAWACIDDGREITLIVEESKINNIKPIKKEKDFRLITFDANLDFSLTGFISNISNKLAEAKIPIFVISAFSTDHILVKEQYLKNTTKQLEALYFKVI